MTTVTYKRIFTDINLVCAYITDDDENASGFYKISKAKAEKALKCIC